MRTVRGGDGSIAAEAIRWLWRPGKRRGFTRGHEVSGRRGFATFIDDGRKRSGYSSCRSRDNGRSKRVYHPAVVGHHWRRREHCPW